jgi:D-galactarolactone cycloisomerase
MKAEEKLKGGTFTYNYYTTVLVRAVCDGVEGWGEAMTRAEPRATVILAKEMAKLLIGKRLEGPSEAWRILWRNLRVRGHTRGTDVEALSGLEMALYDCKAKLSRKPLNLMLSQSPKARVGAYAGSLFESRGPLESQVEEVIAAGLDGAKVKIGFGPHKDLELLKRVRKLLANGMLVADANCAYDVKTARTACRLFADLDLAWLEEPLLSDDWDGYEKLRSRNPVKIGAGESWFAGDFDETVRRGLVQVLEPSVSRCGGIGTEVLVGKLAAQGEIGFSPMTGMNSAISVAASIHVASAVPSLGVEYNPFANPLQTDLAVGLPKPKSGKLEVPRGHGLGVEVDMRFVRRHTA